MEKILIVGSEGFIGKALTESLKSSEDKIFTMDIKPSSFEGHFQIDITNSLDIFNSIKSIMPDRVIHLAAQIDVRKSFVDPEQDLRINGLGLLNVLTASIESGCKNFCYIHSGGAVYDSDGELPISEDGAELPVSPYGLTKSLGEGYVRVLSEKAGINWSSLALSNCFGPVEQHGRGVIFSFAKSLKNGEQVIINGPETTRDFIYIDDVVSAILLAIDKPTNCRINISSGIETNLLELYSMVSKILEVNISPKIIPATFGEITRSALSNFRAKELLRWSPVNNLNDGLIKALENK